MTLAMSGATPEDAGLASGLVNTTAQVGGALGLAVLATLSATRTDTTDRRGESTAAALTSGYHLAFWIGAALVVAAIVVALTVLQPEAKAAEGLEAEQEPAREPADPRGGVLRGGLKSDERRSRTAPSTPKGVQKDLPAGNILSVLEE